MIQRKGGEISTKVWDRAPIELMLMIDALEIRNKRQKASASQNQFTFSLTIYNY